MCFETSSDDAIAWVNHIGNPLVHGRPRQSQVQPGTARYSAEKTHHVLYYQKAGASRISDMILRGR